MLAWLVPTSLPSIFFYLPEIWLPLHHFTKPCENQWPLYFFPPFVTQHTGPYFPNQGSNLYSLQWKHGVLTTESLGNSPTITVLLSPKVFLSHFILPDFSVLWPIFSLKCPPLTIWFSWRLNPRAPVYPLLQACTQEAEPIHRLNHHFYIHDVQTLPLILTSYTKASLITPVTSWAFLLGSLVTTLKLILNSPFKTMS